MTHLARFTLFLSLGILSCAEERPAINRVQANALAKEFLVGALDDPSDDPVFMSRNFVVDASESQELVGISSASGVERIRWQITENMLFGRRAYSVTGGDNKGTSVEPNGDIIAAYKIEAHFDIRRAYSSASGEELNVVEENQSDRPWQEREYFRVDWSENLVESPVWTTMFFGQAFGSIKLTPISYYESDQNSVDAPHFDADAGYFDITSHFSVEPETASFFGQEVPLCFLMGLFTGSAIYSCEAQEAVVRSSYWRLDQADPDDDFEPFENTDAPLDIFGNPGGLGDSASIGILNPAREHYDPGYGFTDEGLRRYMNIHDLWQQSHQTVGECDADADCEQTTRRKGAVCLASGTCSVPCNYKARQDSNSNGSDDQCENDSTGYDGAQGSQCSARNRCTIPYRDREIQTISYFVNPEMPDDLQDEVTSDGDFAARGPTEDLLQTWNQALQLAVAHAREVECRRTATGPEAEVRRQCHARYFEVNASGADQVQMISYGAWGAETPSERTDILIPCHNPVRSYDAERCGEEGYRARVGDLRHNFVIYWPYNSEAPYGGIGNWRGDPLTGQIMGAAATTMGRSATQSAAQVRDLALVALGELNFEDITGGVAASRFQKELREGRSPLALSSEELQRRVALASQRPEGQPLAAIDPDLESSAEGVMSAAGLPAAETFVEQLKRQLSASPEHAANAYLQTQAAAEPLLGTTLETSLITPEWLVDGLGVSPATAVSSTVLEQASPFRGQDLGLLSYLSGRIEQTLGAMGVCHLDGAASIGSPDLSGMGRYFRDKYPTLSGNEFAETVYNDLWKEAYKGIQLHELGHSLGLLHNFASSYDSMNFNPQYWQLRTHDGTSSQSCEGVARTPPVNTAANDTCLGPRYLDPETDDELGQADEPRPGLNYFANTSTMEYHNTRFFENVGLGQYDVMAMGALYGRVLQTFDATSVPPATQQELEPLLFSQLSDDWFTNTGLVHYTELARRIAVFADARCREASASERERGEWRIVHGKVCMPPPKDYGHWDDFVNVSDPAAEDQNEARKLRVAGDRPASGNVRWPYRFGGDISNSYPHVNPNDAGADLWELTQETIRKNDYEYPLVYFRRQRRGWDDNMLPARTARNFFERLRSYHWAASFTKTSFDAFYDELRANFGNDAAAIEQLRAEAFADDNRLRGAVLAQQDMFQAIATALLKPEPGAYAELPSAFGIADVAPRWLQPSDHLFTVDVADSQFISPDFDSGPAAGGSWEYQNYVIHAGRSLEKALAARALTDGRPVLFTTGRDSYLDSRNLNINFRTNLPQAVDRLLGGVLSQDWATVGPHVLPAADPTLAVPISYRDLSAAPGATLPAGSAVLFPNVGYNQQVASMLFAQLFGRINGDLSLINKMRVWLDGSLSGELTVPEAEQLRFTDPESGLTYIARSFGPEVFYGKTIDQGVGSRMVQRANELLGRAFVPVLDESGALVLDAFGRPELSRDAAGQLLLSEDPEAHTRFREYVGLLDAAVQVSTLFGHGPL